MSDLMLLGILRMPMPEIPDRDDVVTYTQFVQSARQASDRIEQLELELAEAKRDAERIDWMESRYASGFAPALVVDDEGKWAYTEDDISSLGAGCRQVCALVMPEEWRDSAREAIDAAMKEGK